MKFTMFFHTKPLRILNVCDHGSNYTIVDAKDDTLLYTIHWTPNDAPHMTAYHGDDRSKVAGSATYHATKKHGFATANNITLKFPSGTVSMCKEGGFFSTDKRTLRSAALGEVYWKGGYSMTGFLKLVDGNGKSMVEYKGMRVGGRMGTLEIDTELGQEGLDDAVVSGMAMLSESFTSLGNTAAAMSVGGG